MRIVALLALLACVVCGCSISRHKPSIPTATHTSAATETIIEKKAEANAAGDKSAAKALDKALKDQRDAETAGEMRWLQALGVLVCAAGLGLMAYGAAKIGLTILASGGGLVFIPMLVTSLIPYMPYIAIGSLLLMVGGLIWYLRKHIAALNHMVSLHTVQATINADIPANLKAVIDRAKKAVSPK